MHPSRPIARALVLLVAGLGMLGCVAATTSPSFLANLPSPSASLAPKPTQTPAPPASVDSSAEPEPTINPDETNPPDPTPTPIEPIAGCGTGEAGFAAHRSEIPKTLAFGHASAL